MSVLQLPASLFTYQFRLEEEISLQRHMLSALTFSACAKRGRRKMCFAYTFEF